MCVSTQLFIQTSKAGAHPVANRITCVLYRHIVITVAEFHSVKRYVKVTRCISTLKRLQFLMPMTSSIHLEVKVSE